MCINYVILVFCGIRFNYFMPIQSTTDLWSIDYIQYAQIEDAL